MNSPTGQLVFVLIIAAISLIKWLMEKSAGQRARRETTERLDEVERAGPVAPPIRAPRPIATPLPDANAAARRLREALGLPEETELPPPLSRRLDPPAPVPVTQPIVDLERRFVAKIEPPPRAFVPAVRTGAAVVTTAPRTALDELLHSRDGLRKAILAHEILGTPKGLVF